MRKRKDIEEAWKKRYDDELTLEVLLDIRELLIKGSTQKVKCKYQKLPISNDLVDNYLKVKRMEMIK